MRHDAIYFNFNLTLVRIDIECKDGRLPETLCYLLTHMCTCAGWRAEKDDDDDESLMRNNFEIPLGASL